MKSFNITFRVTGCHNCPFTTPSTWCEKYKGEVPTPEQVYKANVYKLTSTCPMYKES